MQPLEILDRMRAAPALRQLGLGELDRLASRGAVRRFRPGAQLLQEGSLGDGIHLVLSGRVAVRKALSSAEPRVIAVRSEGEWVGEMALVDDRPRSATVTAEGAVETLWIPRDAFLEAVARRPEALLDLLRTVTARLRESDSLLIDSLQAKTRSLADTNRRLSRENRRLRGEVDERNGFEGFVGSSAAARRVRAAARRAAESDLPVLVLGETGTGKEVVARAIHGGSERAGGAFVAVNCTLFTPALLESELFGHARGAFTGATGPKQGLVEAADGGTLFLDEIGDMPLALQGALLRFLELGEYRRLGETDVRTARVRVIAATHQDLEAASRRGSFRRDLLYRLDVMRIAIPALRDRREDIPELVRHQIANVSARLGVDPLRIDPAAIVRLSAFDYPGNVRELENEIERLFALLGPGAFVTSDALSPKFQGVGGIEGAGYTDSVRRFKTRLVTEALDEAGGNRAKAAKRLGVHRSNLVRMLRELDLQGGPKRRT